MLLSFPTAGCREDVPELGAGSSCSQPCPGGLGQRDRAVPVSPSPWCWLPILRQGMGCVPPFSPVLLPSQVILAPQVEQSSRGMGAVEMGPKPHFQHHCSSLFVSFQSHSTAGLNYSSLVSCRAGKWSG